MINIPPDIFNRMTGQQPQQGGTFTPSGGAYSGPFGNDTRTPFRTVAPVKEGAFQPAYNQGLNASSAQLYDHFRGRPDMNPVDAGLYGAGATQSLEDFANRGVLPTTTNKGSYPNGGVPWGDDSIVTNSDWVNWMRQQKALSDKDLDWFNRWFQESGTGGNKGWVTGDVRGWGHGRSGLNQENKNRVNSAINYMNSYWSPYEPKNQNVPPPQYPVSYGNIFNGVDQDMINQAMRMR